MRDLFQYLSFFLFIIGMIFLFISVGANNGINLIFSVFLILGGLLLLTKAS